MGKFWDKESVDALKISMCKLLSNFHTNSYRDILFAIIILGQYFQYYFYDTRIDMKGRTFYATGTDCVRKLSDVKFIQLLSSCRNIIIHNPPCDIFDAVSELRECWLESNTKWMYSFPLDICDTIVSIMEADKEWNQLFILLGSSNESSNFEDAMKMLGME